MHLQYDSFSNIQQAGYYSAKVCDQLTKGLQAQSSILNTRPRATTAHYALVCWHFTNMPTHPPLPPSVCTHPFCTLLYFTHSLANPPLIQISPKILPPPPPKYQHHPPINTYVSAYPCTAFQIVCFSSEFIQSC